MTDFQKNNNKKRMWLMVAAVVMAVVAVCLIVANVHLYYRKKELNSQIQELQKKINQLKQQNGQLEKGIQNADNSQYIEKVAREELNMQQPGETAVSFVASPDQSKTPAAASGNWFANAWNSFINSFKK